MNLAYCLDIATSHALFQSDFDTCNDPDLIRMKQLQALAIENIETWAADNSDAIRAIQADLSKPTPDQFQMEPDQEAQPDDLEWCLKITLSLADGDISPMTEEKDNILALTGLRNIIANRLPELKALPFSPKTDPEPEAPGFK